jgi:hypothetical protein
VWLGTSSPHFQLARASLHQNVGPAWLREGLAEKVVKPLEADSLKAQKPLRIIQNHQHSRSQKLKTENNTEN